MKFISELQNLIDAPNFMILGTHNSNGSIHMTIVWYLYENKYFKVSTTTDRVKYKNIQKNPNVSFLIPDNEDYYKYLQVQGVVERIESRGGHDFIDKLSQRYLEVKKYPYDTEREEKRVTIFIKPEYYFSYGIK